MIVYLVQIPGPAYIAGSGIGTVAYWIDKDDCQERANKHKGGIVVPARRLGNGSFVLP